MSTDANTNELNASKKGGSGKRLKFSYPANLLSGPAKTTFFVLP